MHAVLFTILTILAAVLAIAVLCHWAQGFSRPPRIYRLANIAEGTHNGSITKLTDAAITARHLLVSFGTNVGHIAASDADDIPLGTVPDLAAAAELEVEVSLLGVGDNTKLMVASEEIVVGEELFTASGGKVQDLPVSAGTYYSVGYALNAAAANNDLVEVQHHTPRKIIVT